MKSASILIKPASSACNINCKYCFYKKLVNKRELPNSGIMSEETLELLIKNAIDYVDDFLCFAFQGGEPTLAGLEFYKKAIKLQKKYNNKNIQIQNTIQTNGTLIDEEWAKFLHENNILVGLSLDGTRRVNDYCRIDGEGNSIFSKEMKTINIFNEFRVEYNIVSVVTSLSVDKVSFIYNFFKDKGFKYLQFIPCLDEGGDKREYSLTPKAYGKFLNRLFDMWYEDFKRGYGIDIRMFSNLAQMAAGYMPEECGMSGNCSTYFVVEANGDVYPCDFYAVDQWKLGTVEQGFKEMYESKLSLDFMNCSKNLHKECYKCKYISLCHSGCRRWREPLIDGKANINYLCEGYKIFFEHCKDRILLLGEYINRKMNN